MLSVLISTFTLFAILGALAKKLSHRRIANAAKKEFCEFRAWIRLCADDPCMSDQKLKNLIPLCQFADDRYEALVEPLAREETCVELVRRILGEAEEEDAFA